MENRQFEAMLAVAQERLAQHIPEDIAEKAGAQYADGSISLKTLGQTVTVRLSELFCKLFSKFVRQVGEIILTESGYKEISCNDVVDITIRIAQRTVERQTVRLSGLAADQRNGLFKGIHGLDISADESLHTSQIITDLRFIRSLSRLHHQDVHTSPFLSHS